MQMQPEWHEQRLRQAATQTPEGFDFIKAACFSAADYISFLSKCLIENTRPLEFVQMSEIDEQSLDLIRRYVGIIDEMEGKRTTSRDAADLDAERAELHNEIIARLQAKRITWDKRGDVTNWCYTVVRWYGK